LHEFGVESPRLDGLRLVARSCGWWWPFAGAVVLTERPSINKIDELGLLHCEDGPAIQYRDGFSVYSWRGTRIPAEWITDKASLTAKTALTWANGEQRRAAVQIVGWDRIIEKTGGKVMDADGDPQIGTLLQVNLPDLDEPELFLRVRCGTGRNFSFCVPKTLKDNGRDRPVTTALEAQFAIRPWLKSLAEFTPPEVRT
jgi:hypothetical protein